MLRALTRIVLVLKGVATSCILGRSAAFGEFGDEKPQTAERTVCGFPAIRRRKTADRGKRGLRCITLATLKVRLRSRHLSLAILVALWAGTSGSSGLNAKVLAAGPGAPHATLQSAIAAARPGDTIQVSTGTYEGLIVLDRPLHLEGIGRPVLRGSGRGSVLTVLAGQCTIRGFVIEQSGKDLQAEDSGILLKSDGNVVANNELRDVLYGIYLYQSAGNTLRGNVIHGRKELPAGERGAGLHLWNSAGNLIEDNVVEQARDGMYIQSSPRNTIRRNRVSHLRYGLHFMSSDDNHFEENLFSHNVAGAAIMYSKGIEFRRNAFVYNRGFSSFGILFQDCDRCLSEDNLVAGNATGLFAEALRNSVFRNNIIAENDVALQIYGSSSNLSFSGNRFVENLSPLHVIGKHANARWEINGQGNYWSDYDGYDLDGDNVGDRPHRIQNVFEYLEGNYPRLRIYLSSPAAQALAAAERAFPVIQPSSESDARPIMRVGPLPAGVASLAPKPSSDSGLAGASVVMLAAGLLMLWQGRRGSVA
jgi:nitrous oxidase accessory protein